MAVATDNSQGVLSRVNPRVVTVAAVILLPLAWMVWTFAKLSISSIETVGKYTTVDLKSLGYFPFSEVDGTVADVPKPYAALDGKQMLLVGQMVPDNKDASPFVDHFQLVYSIQNCCFNGPPKVQERVFAHVPPGGRKVPVLGGLTKVYGTLHVRAVRAAGVVARLYDMDVEKIEEVQN